MNIQEFQRWAEGQRVPASARLFLSPKPAPSEPVEDVEDAPAESVESNVRPAGGTRRFLGTLRWGK
jgi:hypothetical protein